MREKVSTLPAHCVMLTQRAPFRLHLMDPEKELNSIPATWPTGYAFSKISTGPELITPADHPGF
jgi:hypothetical protein